MKTSMIIMAGLGTAVAVTAAVAQEPATTELRPAMVMKDPFAHVTGARELAAGNVLVVDGSDNRIWIVNPKTEQKDLVGSIGTGPLQYQGGWATSAVGSETAIHDFRSHRLLIVDANGKPVRTRPVPSISGLDFGPALSFHVDNRGVIYEYSSEFVRGAHGLQPADARAILRIEGDPARIDTVAMIPVPRGDAMVQRGSGGGTTMLSGQANPFVPRDAWTVAGDGRVAIVHAAPYRLEWISPQGAHTMGPVISYTPVAVTQADKAAYSTTHRGDMTVSVGVEGGSPSASEGGRTDWPAVKAPFGFEAALAHPDGSIWVLRNGAAGDSHNHYDVFDAGGRVTRRVDVPGDCRIVGFGRSAVYAVRKSGDAENFVVLR